MQKHVKARDADIQKKKKKMFPLWLSAFLFAFHGYFLLNIIVREKPVISLKKPQQPNPKAVLLR